MEDPTTPATPVVTPETIVGISIVCCALVLGLVLLICLCARKVALLRSRRAESDCRTTDVGTESPQYSQDQPPLYSKIDLYPVNSVRREPRNGHFEMTNPLSYITDCKETDVAKSGNQVEEFEPQTSNIAGQEPECQNIDVDFSKKSCYFCQFDN